MDERIFFFPPPSYDKLGIPSRHTHNAHFHMAVYFLEKSPAIFLSLSLLQVTHHRKVMSLRKKKQKAISSLHFIHYFVMCT